MRNINKRAFVAWITGLLTVFFGLTGQAQHLTLRTNLLYDATLTPNLGAELRLDSLWAVGLHAGLNAWDIDKEQNKKWRHVLVAPSVRKYQGFKRDTLCIYGIRSDGTYGVVRDSVVTRRANYLEANIIYSHFNVGNTSIPFGLYDGARHRRLQGDLIALGAKYGWQWRLSPLLLLEAEAGLAVGYAWFKEYDCPHCGDYHGRDSRPFLMPQLGLNIVLDPTQKKQN